MSNVYNNLLIITSTVYVNSNLTVLVDPEIRKRQYVDSILFYISAENVDQIIICDNSNFDYSTIDAIRNLALVKAKSLEFLCFAGNSEMIQEKGKGFGEGEIMQYIFLHSQLLKDNTHFYKVTGRVKVANIDTVIKTVNVNAIHFQKIRINPFLKVKLIDSRFYRCSKEVFSTYLIDVYRHVNDLNGYYLEHAYTNALNGHAGTAIHLNDQVKPAIITYRNFSVLPRYIGISGSHGGSLAQGFISYHIKAFLNFAVEKYHSFTTKY